MTTDNILNFPDSTLYVKKVPKTAFYKHLEVNAKMKQHFVDDVDSMTWLYKLAPSTLNVVDGKTVHEIVVFHVLMKDKDCPSDVFTFIDKNMPRHVLFVLQLADHYRLLLNYKEWISEKEGTFNIVKSFATEWMPRQQLGLTIEGQTMDKVYESFAGFISGFGTKSSEDTKRIVELQEQIEKKTRMAEALQKKVRAEKQFNRQIELNSEAKNVKREIAALNNELNNIKE